MTTTSQPGSIPAMPGNIALGTYCVPVRSDCSTPAETASSLTSVASDSSSPIETQGSLGYPAPSPFSGRLGIGMLGRFELGYPGLRQVGGYAIEAVAGHRSDAATQADSMATQVRDNVPAAEFAPSVSSLTRAPAESTAGIGIAYGTTSEDAAEYGLGEYGGIVPGSSGSTTAAVTQTGTSPLESLGNVQVDTPTGVESLVITQVNSESMTPIEFAPLGIFSSGISAESLVGFESGSNAPLELWTRFFFNAGQHVLTIPFVDRTLVAGSEQAGPMTTFTEDQYKDPVAIEPFTVDWTGWLAGDAIATSTWDVPAGITRETDSVDGPRQKVTIWLGGGTVLNDYECSNTITTDGGRTERAAFKIRIR